MHLEAYGPWEAIQSNIVTRKKDCQSLSIIFGSLLEDIVAQLDISKSSTRTWVFLKTRHVGHARIIKARVHAVRHEFETMFMGEEELVVDFDGKLSKVATQLRSLEEKIDDGGFSHQTSSNSHRKAYFVTSSIEKFGHMD